MARGVASEILNMSARNARWIVSALLDEGLLQSSSHRSPLTIGLPVQVLVFYFPRLYDPSVIGEEYLGSAKSSVKGQSTGRSVP
ncbi:MAG: hypothetical protein SWH78_08440 [Thermodesulfobacteriota bacterium]|nr:hypothetical protein [Thermodesulfobacteriota bacterium]